MTSATALRMTRAGHRAPGFTLIEMLISLVLILIVFAITIPFFRAQSIAVQKNIGRSDAMQSAQLAQAAIDRELRLAGGVTGQPVIVQAAPFALTFNVDLVTRLTNDANATYYNPDADSLAVEAWEPSRAKVLATSGSKNYPATLYTDATGIQSQAETISYFLYRDSSSGRNDLYTLFRRVNDRDSVVMARNLWIPSDTNYFFTYTRTDATGNMVAIPNASLPIYWDAASHYADSIRVVGMRVASLYRDTRLQKDVVRTLYYNTTLLNAGMLQLRTCGTAPLPALLPVATQVFDAFGTLTNIHLTWNASLEEAGGEKDVALYLVMRRPSASTDWEVLGNVVAQGIASYSFDDFNFKSGSWVYGVVAQDCSPANSPMAAAVAVVNP
ncbi:MAG: type II secretion system protein [Gemmatimonadota bacterium]|nr:type II secretion system protein [Gemmatimonadota bacterium]